MSSQISRKGGFWVSGQYYPNTLLQSAFDMIGDFMTGETGATPAKLGILDASLDEITMKDADFTQNPFTPPSVGVTVRADAVFGADEVTSDIAFFVLADSLGVHLAIAEVDPPIPASTGIVVTREDVFSEA